MGVRDRFFTPATARAILSWRILLGAAVGVVAGVVGAPWLLAGAIGAAVYAGSVAVAMPRAASRPKIDPFVVGEPWRQIVQSAQSSGRKLRETVAGTPDGPLRQRLTTIAEQVEHGLDEVWKVALRGDEIDDIVRRLDPTALRSKLATLEQRAAADPAPELTAAIESVRRQLGSSERLTAQSNDTAAKLRLNQTRLDELVARASEVRVGVAEPDTYARDVDDLVVQLEALHLAVAETHGSESPSP